MFNRNLFNKTLRSGCTVICMFMVALSLGRSKRASAQHGWRSRGFSSRSLPNGTLVLGNKHSLLGRMLSRRMSYSHVGIVIDGKVCESDWPHVQCTPISRWQKSRTSYDWYVPNRPLSHGEEARLRGFVNRTLGQPYRLKNYLFPGSRRTRSGWCSTWAARALNSTGRYNIRRRQAWNPGLLHAQVGGDYRYARSTRR